MKNFIKIFLLIGIIITIHSCDYFCADRKINLALIGFDSHSLDTIIVKRYRLNSSFQDLIASDSITFPRDSSIYKYNGDTTVVSPWNGINFGYDWKIYIPAKNQTITITNITSSGYDKHGCLKPISSFEQDDKTIESPKFYFYYAPDSRMTGYKVFIYSK